MSSDPPAAVPRLVSAALVAELADVLEHYRHTGVQFAVAVVVTPAPAFSEAATILTNMPDTAGSATRWETPAARRALLTALLAGPQDAP